MVNRQFRLDYMGKEEYLADPDVKSFISWMDKLLDLPDGFRHQYYLAKAKQQWQCNCLYDAYDNYWWHYKLKCPLQGKEISGTSIQESIGYMNLLAKALRNSVENRDTGLLRMSALAMLEWGGVLNRNRQLIEDMGEEICDYFMWVKDNLNLTSTHLGDHQGIIINSGFTKIYSLLIDDFIMYDGRVGAALGLLGRMYAEEIQLGKIPEMIKFSFGSGKVSPGRKRDVNRRNPSTKKYKFSSFNGNQHRHINDNIKASWLLKQLAEKTTSRFSLIPQDKPLNTRLTAIQSALFMVGYDVQTGSKP